MLIDKVFTAIRRASSLVSSLAAESAAGFSLIVTSDRRV
jgi:hypothetical protein